MAEITDYLVISGDGAELKADPFGESLAFACGDCGHPVVAVAEKGQRGSSIENSSVCRGCWQHYVVEVRESVEKIVVYRAHEL
ncbi:hypothetical protein HXX02_00205 [Microbulbifer elongatus]|uniref:Uncharacterized protein n=1 Tax=Microbulbifer elongatus TaxID=86173 RepID=A0ABT1NVL9_9GAMM|nr:hypothetical protein [Microbulbifer elongatus]MCQ3827857.1 hypothetical protein [Microbulbifer elongatus]